MRRTSRRPLPRLAVTQNRRRVASAQRVCERPTATAACMHACASLCFIWPTQRVGLRTQCAHRPRAEPRVDRSRDVMQKRRLHNACASDQLQRRRACADACALMCCMWPTHTRAERPTIVHHPRVITRMVSTQRRHAQRISSDTMRPPQRRGTAGAPQPHEAEKVTRLRRAASETFTFVQRRCGHIRSSARFRLSWTWPRLLLHPSRQPYGHQFSCPTGTCSGRWRPPILVSFRPALKRVLTCFTVSKVRNRLPARSRID